MLSKNGAKLNNPQIKLKNSKKINKEKKNTKTKIEIFFFRLLKHLFYNVLGVRAFWAKLLKRLYG